MPRRTDIISSSHGELVVDILTGLVIEDESRYDNDELRNIVKFDVAEWETYYRRLFAGGDILDYGYSCREPDPRAWNFEHLTIYEHPSTEWRLDRAREFPALAVRFEHFEMNPCFLLDASNNPVPYNDVNGITYEAAVGHEEDPLIACWSVYGFTEKNLWQCLSDHKNKEDAEFHLNQWRTNKKEYDKSQGVGTGEAG